MGHPFGALLQRPPELLELVRRTSAPSGRHQAMPSRSADALAPLAAAGWLPPNHPMTEHTLQQILENQWRELRKQDREAP